MQEITVDVRTLRRMLERSNMGNDYGWVVMYQGEEVAILDDAHLENYPWGSFRITPLPAGEAVKSRFDDAGFWVLEAVIRNRQLPLDGEFAFANPPLDSSGRLRARGPLPLGDGNSHECQ
jgi:hypothetical protein